MEQLPADPGHIGLDLRGHSVGRAGHTAELPATTADNHSRVDISELCLRRYYFQVGVMVLGCIGYCIISKTLVKGCRHQLIPSLEIAMYGARTGVRVIITLGLSEMR